MNPESNKEKGKGPPIGVVDAVRWEGNKRTRGGNYEPPCI